MSSAVKLTKRVVDAAEPRDAEWILNDTQLRGFGVRVYPSGRKVYCYRYRSDEGARRRLNLGTHGATTVDAARARALESAARVSAGEDPAEARRAARDAPKVSDLLDRFLVEHVGRHLKATSAREYERICSRYIAPALGHERVSAVTPAKIEALLKRLQSRPAMANRVLAVLSSAYGFAAQPAVGWATPAANPAKGVRKNRERRRTRSFSDKELIGILRGLECIERQGGNPGAIAALQLSLLLGWRISECLSLRWVDVDLEQGTAILRDAKSGTRTARLSAAACELLAGVERAGSVVAPGRDLEGPVDYKVAHRIWKKACSFAGVEDAQIHDCRRSIATRLANQNASAAVLQAVLGHSTSHMALRYVADARSAAADAVDAYGDLIQSLER